MLHRGGRGGRRKRWKEENVLKRTTDPTPGRDSNGMAFHWNPEFMTRRDISYTSENEIYIESLGYNGNDEGDNIIRAFMRGDECSDICLPESDLVEEFCSGITLENLCVDKGDDRSPTLSPVALLDERSFGDERPGSRTYRGPLTALDLYNQLKRPRFRCVVPGLHDGTNVGTEQTQTPIEDIATVSPITFEDKHGSSQQRTTQESQRAEPDADIRIIFITDLDAGTIYALIGTASYSQSSAVRNAIYRHLASEAYIGVTLNSQGLTIFQLAFHLPYYAWRSSPVLFKDYRRNTSGEPLRRSLDVSFLSGMESDTASFLYEATVSCVVSGSDDWRWVAYCFVDTYFDAGNEGRESVQEYHEAHMDPCTYGMVPLEDHLQNPREWFLLVLKHRLRQSLREWRQVVFELRTACRYQQTHTYPTHLNVGKGDDETTRAYLEWVVKVRELLSSLTECLSSTVNACERFCSEYSPFFQCLPEYGHRLYRDILETLSDLIYLEKQLEAEAERYERLCETLILRLTLVSIEVTKRPVELAKHERQISFLLKLFTPLTMTAAIFSLDPVVRKDVLPFIPANFLSFVCLIIFFGIPVMAIHTLGERDPQTKFGAQTWGFPSRKVESITASNEPNPGNRSVPAWDVEKVLDDLAPSNQTSLGTHDSNQMMCSSQSIQCEPDSAIESLAPPSYSEGFEDFEYQPTISDWLKIYCERLVGQQLVWWPFKEPARPVQPGMRRLAYQCDCGTTVTFDVPAQPHSTPLSTPLAGLFRTFGGADVSQSLLPTHAHNVLAFNNHRPTPTSNQSRSPSQELVEVSASTNPPSLGRVGGFIAWCVGHDDDHAQLVQLNALNYTDHTFAVTLLATYTEIMGWWYLFLTMSSCQKVLFKEFHFLDDLNLVQCGTESTLPGTMEYQYDNHPNGQPVDAKVVSKLESRVTHCVERHSGAKWPWSRCKSWWSCSRYDSKKLLKSIPKKVTGPVAAGPNAVGYGMQAVTRIAVSKVMVVCLVWHIGPVCFAMFWLRDHPGDLQNAFILLSIVVMIFAVYVDIMFRVRR